MDWVQLGLTPGKLRKLRLRAWICLTPLATIQTPQLRVYVCLFSQAVCDREVWSRDPISTTIPRLLPPKHFCGDWGPTMRVNCHLGHGLWEARRHWRATEMPGAKRNKWKLELVIYLDPVIWNLYIVFASLLHVAGHSKIVLHVARCTTSNRTKTLPFQWFLSQAKCHRNHYQTLVLSDLQKSHGNKHHFRSSTIKANDFGLNFNNNKHSTRVFTHCCYKTFFLFWVSFLGVNFNESVCKTRACWAGDGGTPKHTTMARISLKNSIIQQPESHGKIAEWQNALLQKITHTFLIYVGLKSFVCELHACYSPMFLLFWYLGWSF